MKKICLFLFRVSFDFIDNQHVKDFIEFDRLYRIKRSMKKRMSQVQIIETDKTLRIGEKQLDQAIRYHMSGWFIESDGVDRFKHELGFK